MVPLLCALYQPSFLLFITEITDIYSRFVSGQMSFVIPGSATRVRYNSYHLQQSQIKNKGPASGFTTFIFYFSFFIIFLFICVVALSGEGIELWTISLSVLTY